MSFPRYDSYRNSGVEWLGDVPSHWTMSRLGFETWVRARLGWKGLKAEEYVDDGYAMLSTPDIKGAEINFNGANRITQARYDESPEIKLRKGDVLLAKDGSTLGTVNLVRELVRPSTVNSSLAVITPHERLIDLFLLYYFQSAFITARIEEQKGGMGVPHLFQDDLVKFPMPLPPVEEQRTIGFFLDKETAKIDALVEEQRQFIELLREKRHAVISHAVTKGLDPTARVKDTGIESLGEVPVHWSVLQLGRVIDRIEQGWSPPAYDREPEAGEASVLRLSAIKDGKFDPTQRKALPELSGVELDAAPVLANGDFLLTRANTPELVGDCAISSDVTTTIFSDLIYRLSFSADALPKYMVIALRSPPLRAQIRRDARGSSMSMAKLSHGHIKSWLIALPPIEEQAAIVSQLETQLSGFGQLIEEAEAAIALLQERRTALISAAVAGKIDVRGVVAAPLASEAA